MPINCIVRAIPDHPDRLSDGDAHRRLLGLLFALRELGCNRDSLPSRDDRATVSVVVLFLGWILALRGALIGAHRPYVD